MVIHYYIEAATPETVDLVSFAAFAVWLKRMKVQETATSQSVDEWREIFDAFKTGAADFPVEFSRDDHYYLTLTITDVEQ
jgi:hypothetical protein